MDSNAFLNDLMSKMKLPEAKGKKKAEQSESVAQILAVMQKVKTEKKKPPVTSYAPVKEMPMNEPDVNQCFQTGTASGSLYLTNVFAGHIQFFTKLFLCKSRCIAKITDTFS